MREREETILKVEATPTPVAKKTYPVQMYAHLEGHSAIETFKWTPGGGEVTKCCGSSAHCCGLETTVVQTCTTKTQSGHLLEQRAAV